MFYVTLITILITTRITLKCTSSIETSTVAIITNNVTLTTNFIIAIVAFRNIFIITLRRAGI